LYGVCSHGIIPACGRQIPTKGRGRSGRTFKRSLWVLHAADKGRTKRRNAGMKEYRNKLSRNSTRLRTKNHELRTVLSKRTHFTTNYELRTKNFFVKRTQFPHFSANFETSIFQLSIVHCQFRRSAATKRTQFPYRCTFAFLQV
jgi:hypothetical protein